jgi:endo-1,4-beta-mannosidase
MNQTLKNELIEVFADQIKNMVTWRFSIIIGEFGTSARGVYNSKYVSEWRETIRFCVENVSKNPAISEYTLSSERLDAFSAKIAEEMAVEVLQKVSQKVGELDDAEVLHVGSANFTITGKKKGHAVKIEQQQIVNVSSKGKLFNQYPSRIYVDGKFTSAAKFGKI